MKKSTSFALIVLVQALLLSVSTFAALTVSPPHYDEAASLVCTACHTSHLDLGSTGYNNVCMNCHRPGDPAAGSKSITLADAANPFGNHSNEGITKSYQTSHRWDGSTTNPQAGARPPVQAKMTTSGLLSRTGGQLACVSCHNQHSNDNGKFLRMANDRDQMCLDCHRSRNTTDHTQGTHPVGVVYDGTKTGFKPIPVNSANPTADLNNYLKSGTVSCSTCHGVHFTDSNSGTVDGSAHFVDLSGGDGTLLRVSPYGKTADDINICSTCHDGKKNHNLGLKDGKSSAQCNHCHSGHVEYDAAAVGTETTPNVYLVRRYLQYTTAGRISKRIIYNSTTTKNFYSPNGGGVCQSCHNPPADHLLGSAVEPGHLDCATCHTHTDVLGAFSVSADVCTRCHGQPPSTGDSGGPTGKATGYATFDESLTPHASHTGGTQYNYLCSECHAGNTHNSGSTFTDVFKSTAGILAGTEATYASPTCGTVYCHSSGRGTYKGGVNTVAWGENKGSIIGQASECTTCHDSSTYSSSHDKHINNQAYGCETCHAATVSSNSVLLATAKLAGGTHVNSIKDVKFSGVVPATGTSCATVWCHGGDTTLIPQNSPDRTAPVWGTPFPTTSSLGTGGPAGTSGSGYCAQCHGYPPLTLSHTAKTASTCAGCHSHINSDALTFNDAAKHINGTIDASGHAFPYSGSLHLETAGTTPWSSCATAGCHTNAAGSYPVASGTAPNCQACHLSGLKVPSGTSSCWDCHGATATDGLPTGTSFPNIAGSHAVHAIITGTVCATCHSGGGNGAVTHGSSNRKAATPASVTVAFTGQGSSPAWTFDTNTCSATNCHGQGAPTWGATAVAPVNGFPYATTQCAKCHGTAASNPFYSTAMPKETANTNGKVGAHSDHLSGAKNISSAIACLECHMVPAVVSAAGHMDGTTQVAFNGTLATANSSTATSCATTWCHGGNTTLLPQNSPARTAPAWGTRFPTTSTLGSGGPAGTSGTGYCAQCHGYPPLTSIHAGKTQASCIGCHAHLNSDALTFNDKTKHINGNIDASGHVLPYSGSLHLETAGTSPWSNCSVCHTTNAAGVYPVAAGVAPNCQACHIGGLKAPSGTSSCYDCHGATATDGLPTGASFPNIAGSHAVHAAIAGTVCATCHSGGGSGVVTHGSSNRTAASPASVKVVFTGQGTSPVWTLATNTCSATNCHGQGAPTWGATAVAPVNGFPYSTTQCAKCHGSAATNPFYSTAMPKETANTNAKVGAHSDHLSGAKNISSAIACLECHAVPAVVSAAGHMDGTTQVTFTGTLAKANSTTATSCATTWCHGGNTALIPQSSPARTAPVWGTRFPTTSTLGTGGPSGTSGSGYCAQCHGYPPLTAIHTGKTASTCVGCHAHINSDGLTFNDKSKHIDGTINASGGHVFPYSGSLHLSAAGTTPWSSCATAGCHTNAAGSYPVAPGTAPNCQACHIGGLKQPSGTSSCWDCHGATATNGLPNGTSFPNIAGSHAAHATVTAVCATCHTGGGNGVVTHGSSNRTAASPASVKVVFTGQGTSPVWTLATNTCSATNCHGQGAPTWGATVAAPVNGFPYSATQCAKCHGSAATNPFYSTAIPKVTTNTNAKVGAHSDHLFGTKNISTAIACPECHVVPTAVTDAGHMNGTTLVAFNGTLAKSNTTTPTTCATTWCHGGNTTLVPQSSPARTAPVWGTRFPTTSTLGTGGPSGTSGSGYCAQCHGYPPLTASHTGKTASTCVGCHSHINSDGLTFNDKSKHIDGTINASGGHVFPYSGSLHLSAAGTTPWSSCATAGCHTNAAGSYPVAPGTAPNCQACHIGGLKAPSGTSSCWDCHGATATNGQPNGTSFPNIAGSHAAHATVTTVCTTCHTGGGNGTVTHGSSNRTAASPASVIVAFTGQGSSPAWTFATRTCSATNCHGQGAPTWGSTYVAPGNSFPYSSSQCGKCHAQEGAISAGTPFYSTAIPKMIANTNGKVGAHTAHLASVDSLHPALTCADCHGAVTLNSPTHMNGSTTLVFSALAKTGNLNPTYDPSTGQCTNVYCHGGGMPGGDTSGSNKTPIWSNPDYLPTTLTVAGCGTCHGFPPPSSSHTAVTIPVGFPETATIGTTCSCHDNVRQAGNSYATIFVNSSLHINGTLNGGACNSCHGYPPASSGFVGSVGSWENAGPENYVGGGGAHTINAHVSKLAKYNDGFAFCIKCHSPADHVTSPAEYKPSTNIKVNVDSRYRFEAAKQFKYTSNRLDGDAHVTGTCLNSSCHFGATPKWDPNH